MFWKNLRKNLFGKLFWGTFSLFFVFHFDLLTVIFQNNIFIWNSFVVFLFRVQKKSLCDNELWLWKMLYCCKDFFSRVLFLLTKHAGLSILMTTSNFFWGLQIMVEILILCCLFGKHVPKGNFWGEIFALIARNLIKFERKMDWTAGYHFWDWLISRLKGYEKS